MNGNNVREKYLQYMKERGHSIIPSSPLVPENDPTTLFTGSGMQPLVPYLMGETHPKGSRLTNSQKCFRAEDIEEVGDNRHTTFFEMLGNWSLGDYFKKEQLTWFYDFLVLEVKLNPENIYVTVFQGDEENGVPRDTESVEIWQTLFTHHGVSKEVGNIGSEENGGKRGMKNGERIFYYDANKNWWSRSGKPKNMPTGEIGGPDSEVFYDFGTEHDVTFGEYCHPNCDCGRFLEIGNSVFIEYIKKENGSFTQLPKRNVDFGGGLERITAAINNDGDVFKIDLLWKVVEQIQELSEKKYEDNLMAFRVITDHIRGAVFMIGDDVLPSNSEQGYFVRRLLRRAVRYADKLDIPAGELKNLAYSVIEIYKNHYTNIVDKSDIIANTIATEEIQFRKTLDRGLREFEKITSSPRVTLGLSGEDAYVLFTTYGFPYELTEELAAEKKLTVDKEAFNKKMKEHQETSRAGSEHKFKGGLADGSKTVVQYHTATHLLLAGLRKFLGNNIHQAGSNITNERLRFDVTHPEKIDKEILDKIERFVNDSMQNGGEVVIEMMSKNDAENDNTIEGSFWEKYPDEVKVYTIKTSNGEIVSRELCGGPHIENLSELANLTFKITKESSSSAGVRRIKAVLK